MIQRVYVDISILLSLFFIPKLSFLSSGFNLYDEIVFLYMVVAIISRVFIKKRDLLFPILLMSYIGYSLFLLVYNSLPITHIMQIFITSKFLIIFLYFYTNTDKYKTLFFLKFMKLIIFIFALSLVISILQFVLPSYFGGYAPDARGFMGINAGGIFFSRILYSSFIVMFIILLMSIKVNYQGFFQNVIKYRYWILIISLILLFLTFARKEMVIGFVILIYLFKDKIKNSSKVIFYFLLMVILFFIGVLFIILFADINNRTFSENQIRYLMLLHSLDIFSYYFPFGSGPGTYGSIMSIGYTDIYEKFDVARHIYLGYGDDVRGPIFDLFLFGLLAEYGVGILLILWILKKMAFSSAPEKIEQLISTRKAKVALTIHLFIVALFVPIFSNWMGFLFFTLLAVMSTKRRKSDVITA